MEGFVLKHDAAIDYLKEAAAGFYREAVENGEECGEAIEDCASMARRIAAEGWGWVLFTEHPMAPSQLNVQEMKSEADMLDQTATGTAKSSLDFRRQLVEHCRRWGYNYKIKSVKRLNAEG